MHIARLEAEVEALDLSIESEEEEEDEVGELVTGEIAGEFLEVYSRIRDRDASLYDTKTEFFKHEGDMPAVLVEAKEQAKNARPDKKQKRDHLEATIIRAEDEEDLDLEHARSAGQLSIAEQDQQLKKEFQKAFFDDDNKGEYQGGDDDDLLVEKQKSRDEELYFEDEYKKFLDGKKKEKIAFGGESVRAFWALDETAKAVQLSESEKFLRKYILDNGWVDEEAATRRVSQDELDALSDSEEELDKADAFEAKLNFRHEEPGASEGPVSYPRNLPSVRSIKPSTRQKQRERTKESKKADRQRLAEDLKRLKAAKRKEMLERMKRSGMAGDEEDELEAKMASMDEKELEQFMDEYLKLDFQGTVGDMQTRFKYTQVNPDSYGLEEKDILELHEEVLEKYVPMHAIAPYRDAPEWKPTQSKRRELKMEKQRVEAQIEGELEQEEEEEQKRERRRGEKREKRLRKKKQEQKVADEEEMKKRTSSNKAKKKKKKAKKQTTIE
jgi:hypothetical protein